MVTNKPGNKTNRWKMVIPIPGHLLWDAVCNDLYTLQRQNYYTTCWRVSVQIWEWVTGKTKWAPKMASNQQYKKYLVVVLKITDYLIHKKALELGNKTRVKISPKESQYEPQHYSPSAWVTDTISFQGFFKRGLPNPILFKRGIPLTRSEVEPSMHFISRLRH